MKEIIIGAFKTKILGWTPKTQYASLIHIIIINEIFGLRVFEFKGRLRYDWSIIYASMCIILYAVYTNEIINISYKNWPAYQEISYKLTMYINIIGIIIFIILGMLNTKRSRKIIARCEQIDNTLESFGIEKNYQKTFFCVTQTLITSSIIMISIISLDYYSTIQYQDNLNIFIFIAIITMSLGILTFTILISILQDKLHKINKIIKEIYQLSNTKDINIRYNMQSLILCKFVIIMDYNNRKYFVQHFLQITRYIHFEVLKLLRELNQAYTYQIVLDLIMQFSSLLSVLYNGYFYLISLKLSEVLSNKGLIGFFVWIFLFFIKIIFLNNHCTKFYNEIKITTHLLQELDICYLDNSIRNEIQQFLLQLLLHPFKFTAGGYILSNKLSAKFFGTLITYLIIFIQISTSINMK
ncbi:uncharacterized protein LOC102681347 isoform X2 [Apis dorsata]|uniref:uncharacterized protein LOC102681347 isoform X2 n=1 Tax=Apis dorsata TaxID=7462 RepID=UPI001292F494|nr:uncharacterized protein LOC102681347 isoform X2 [Apis dorsata]